MLRYEKILLSCSELDESYWQCPDINLGIIYFGNEKFLLRLVYTKTDELEKLGFIIKHRNSIAMVKAYTCFEIRYLRDQSQCVDTLTPSLDDEDNDSIVFRRPYNDIKDLSAFDDINEYINILFSYEFTSKQELMNILIETKNNLSL